MLINFGRYSNTGDVAYTRNTVVLENIRVARGTKFGYNMQHKSTAEAAAKLKINFTPPSGVRNSREKE